MLPLLTDPTIRINVTPAVLKILPVSLAFALVPRPVTLLGFQLTLYATFHVESVTVVGGQAIGGGITLDNPRLNQAHQVWAKVSRAIRAKVTGEFLFGRGTVGVEGIKYRARRLAHAPPPEPESATN